MWTSSEISLWVLAWRETVFEEFADAVFELGNNSITQVLEYEFLFDNIGGKTQKLTAGTPTLTRRPEVKIV